MMRWGQWLPSTLPFTQLCVAAWWCTDVDTFEVYSRGHFWLRGGVQPWTLSRCTAVDTSGCVVPVVYSRGHFRGVQTWTLRGILILQRGCDGWRCGPWGRALANARYCAGIYMRGPHPWVLLLGVVLTAHALGVQGMPMESAARLVSADFYCRWWLRRKVG